MNVEVGVQVAAAWAVVGKARPRDRPRQIMVIEGWKARMILEITMLILLLQICLP
jgi:hypothetical protein